MHPLLYMKDVKLSHLQAVMDFMYQGNVNVDQKELDAFLALASELETSDHRMAHSELKHNSTPL